MNVTGEVLLTQSTTYKITVGKDDAKVSVTMEPTGEVSVVIVTANSELSVQM